MIAFLVGRVVSRPAQPRLARRLEARASEKNPLEASSIHSS
jgi:hypothetical protein